jgi:hypothetical protein
MHQRRGLQGLPGGFLRHARRRQPAQFLINQRQQRVRSAAIPLIRRLEDSGYFVTGVAGHGLKIQLAGFTKPAKGENQE